MSNGQEFRGTRNEGTSTQLGETWQYIEDPLQHVRETQGLIDEDVEGTERTEAEVETMNKTLSQGRSTEIKTATPMENMQWSDYNE